MLTNSYPTKILRRDQKCKGLEAFRTACRDMKTAKCTSAKVPVEVLMVKGKVKFSLNDE